MAAAIKYYTTIYGEQEGSCLVNVWVDGFVGSSTEIKSNSLIIDYEGDGEGLFDMQLQGSSCTLGIEVEAGTALETWLTSLVGSESLVYLEVVRNGSREWIGKLLTDLVQVEDAPFYTYEMVATCGLGQLGDYDFDYALNNANPDNVLLGDLLMAALLPCYTEQFYASSDVFIVSMLNTYSSVQQDYNGVKCPLEVNRVKRIAFIKDVEKEEPLTCKDVIERILTTYGARIRMMNGCWHIVKADAYTQANMYNYKYGNRAYTNGPLSVTSNSKLLAVGSANKLYTEAGNNFTYKPALIRADVNWTPVSKTWFIRDYATGAYYPNIEIDDLDTRPIQIAGKVTYEIPVIFNGVSNVPNGGVRLHFVCKAKDGLTEKYRLTFNSQLGFYWTTNLSAAAYLDLPIPTTPQATGENEIKIILPILTDTTIDNLGFEIYMVNQTQTCSAIIDWSCALEVSQMFSNDTFEEDIQYSAENTELTLNSVYKEVEIYIGDSDNSLVAPAIQTRVYNTSNWQNSATWSVNYATATLLPIGQLLAKTILSMNVNSSIVYQGSFIFGNSLSPINSISYDSKVLFFNAGAFDYVSNTVSGDWIALQSLSAYVSVGTGVPFRGGDVGIRNDIIGIKDNIRDINNGLGDVTINIRALLDRVRNLEQITSRSQPLLVDVITLPEGYTPGTTLPVNMSVDADGKQLITIG